MICSVVTAVKTVCEKDRMSATPDLPHFLLHSLILDNVS